MIIFFNQWILIENIYISLLFKHEISITIVSLKISKIFFLSSYNLILYPCMYIDSNSSLYLLNDYRLQSDARLLR